MSSFDEARYWRLEKRRADYAKLKLAGDRRQYKYCWSLERIVRRQINAMPGLTTFLLAHTLRKHQQAIIDNITRNSGITQYLRGSRLTGPQR